MKIEIDIYDDSATTILVSMLKEQYANLKHDLDARRDGHIKHGVFYSDIHQDIVEIDAHLDSIEVVLSYNMTDEDFKAWKDVENMKIKMEDK